MTDEQRRAALKTIIRHYGHNSQIDKAIEEMAELTKAMLKWRRADGLNDDLSGLAEAVIGGIADVAVMLEQIRIVFRVPDELLEKMMEAKILRQLERMGNHEDHF